MHRYYQQIQFISKQPTNCKQHISEIWISESKIIVSHFRPALTNQIPYSYQILIIFGREIVIQFDSCILCHRFPFDNKDLKHITICCTVKVHPLKASGLPQATRPFPFRYLWSIPVITTAKDFPFLINSRRSNRIFKLSSI